VHSMDDHVVSVAESYDLLAASVDNPMVDSLIVPSGGHANYRLSSPGWFHEILKTFFTYWADFTPKGGQHAGTSGTDTIGTFGNPNN
jgi:hypothetical protein